VKRICKVGVQRRAGVR